MLLHVITDFIINHTAAPGMLLCRSCHPRSLLEALWEFVQDSTKFLAKQQYLWPASKSQAQLKKKKKAELIWSPLESITSNILVFLTPEIYAGSAVQEMSHTLMELEQIPIIGWTKKVIAITLTAATSCPRSVGFSSSPKPVRPRSFERTGCSSQDCQSESKQARISHLEVVARQAGS